MYIYLTTNKVNGKKYVGMCSRPEDDSKDYFGSGTILSAAVKKYGKKNFVKEILGRYNTVEELKSAEVYWIKFYNAVLSEDFYNITEGGVGGDTKCYGKREWRANVSSAVQQTWDNISEEDYQKRCDATRKGIKEKRNTKGSANSMYGRSIVKEKKLRWYTNGKQVIYVPEGTNPSGFYPGRKVSNA